MLESIETSRSSSSMASAITRARVTRRVRVPSRMCCERLMPPFARARWRAWPRLDSNVIDDGGINRCRAVRGDGVADQSAERAELDRRTWFREGVVGGKLHCSTADWSSPSPHLPRYPTRRRPVPRRSRCRWSSATSPARSPSPPPWPLPTCSAEPHHDPALGPSVRVRARDCGSFVRGRPPGPRRPEFYSWKSTQRMCEDLYNVGLQNGS